MVLAGKRVAIFTLMQLLVKIELHLFCLARLCSWSRETTPCMNLPRLVTIFALESSTYPICFSPCLALLKSALKTWLGMTAVNTKGVLSFV